MPANPMLGLVLRHGDKISGWALAIVGTAQAVAAATGNDRVANFCDGVSFAALGLSMSGLWKINRKQTDIIVASEAEKRLQAGTGTAVSVIAKEMAKQVQNNGPDTH